MSKNTSRPEPFDERLEKNKFWKTDPWDKHLPMSKGFITDFTYFQRNTEVPTAFSIWSALFAISSVIKREAWVSWLEGDEMYANLYLWLVSPPALCRKDTTINHVSYLLEHLTNGLTTERTKKIKKLLLIYDKATSEKMLDRMAERGKQKIKLFEDKDEFYEPGSGATIIAPELSTFLGKAKYNEGLISTLLNIYNTKKKSEVSTYSHGIVTLKNLFTNFIGGSTYDGLRDSMSSAALGDGFLSRTIVVYQEKSVHRYFPPVSPTKQMPTRDDLVTRLGWIAQHTIGEHRLSKEALEYAKGWYETHRDRQENGDPMAKIWSRMDIMIMKISLLMKAQRYSLGDEISLQDFKDALTIVETTLKAGPDVVQAITGSEEKQRVFKIKKYIQERGEVERATTLAGLTCTADEITDAVNYLAELGDIEIIWDGNVKKHSYRKLKEIYKWVGKNGDQED